MQQPGGAAEDQHLDGLHQVATEAPSRRARLAQLLRRPGLLFLRILDTDAEVVIEAALRDAWRRGATQPCLMLSWQADSAELDRLLADQRVGAVGVKDADPSQLPPHQLEDPRVGRYFHGGHWTLPVRRRVVYFVGPWRLLTARMLLDAARAGVEELNFRVGNQWGRIRPQQLYRFLPALRLARGLRNRLRQARRLLPRQASARGPALLSEAAACAALVAAAPPPAQPEARLVVMVCGSLSPGGAERQLANTLVGLHQRGLAEVMLLAHYLDDGPSRHGFHLPRVLAAGVGAREINRVLANLQAPRLPAALAGVVGSLPDGLLLDIGNLVLEFQAARPQVVHAWLDWDCVRAGLAAVIAGVPKVILSGRNLNPSHFKLHQPYMLPAYQALARAPQVVFINNSRAGADDYADWIGLPRARIGVLHNGLDYGGRQRPAPEAIATARAALGLPPDAFVVGGVFRLDDEKRPMLWLEVAALVAAAAPEARFVIHGQGSFLRAMQARCAERDLAGRVMLAGVTDDPLGAMACFDVLLLTSHGEGLPNVLLEAQWVGTPVVTTDAGGAREALLPGVTGWVVEQDSASAIAARLLALREDRASLARAGQAGPGFLQQRFGLARMVEETAALYGLPSTRNTPAPGR